MRLQFSEVRKMATTISNTLELTRKGSFVNLTNGLRERCGGELKEGKSEGREPLTSRFRRSVPIPQKSSCSFTEHFHDQSEQMRVDLNPAGFLSSGCGFNPSVLCKLPIHLQTCLSNHLPNNVRRPSSPKVIMTKSWSRNMYA